MTRKILSTIDILRNNKKRPDTKSIFEYLEKKENLSLTEEKKNDLVQKMIKSNLIYNKKSDKGLDSFYRKVEEEEPLDISYLSESTKSVNDENIENIDCNLSNILSQPFNQNLNDLQTPSDKENNYLNEKKVSTSVEVMGNIKTPCLPKDKIVNQKFIWKIEAQIAALKSFVDCEISTLNEKVCSYSENLNKISKSIVEYQEKYANSLEENIKFFKKELNSKDELIKSLVDTQTAVLETVKTRNSTENHHNENLHREKEEINLRKDVPEYEHKPIKSTIIVKNLNANVKSADIHELFGLRNTAYLRKNCNVSLPLNNKTKEHLGYAYLTVPKHVRDEIIKLNGLKFRGHEIVIEDAVTKPKVTAQLNNEKHNFLSPNRFAPLQPNKESYESVDNRNDNIDFDSEITSKSSIHGNVISERRRPSTVVSLYPERQTTFQKPRSVPGEQSYSQAVKSSPRKPQNAQKSNVLIFSDSLTSKIKIFDFNRLFKNGKAKHMFFPGSTSEQILQYLEINLKINNPDAVLFHVGINDVLNDCSDSGLDNILKNFQQMVEKCRKYNVKQVFISGLVCCKRIPYSILENLNMKIRAICLRLDLIYVDNSNIKVSHLYKDKLHLLKAGRDILINNFINSLNRYFLTEENIIRYT